MKNKQWAHPLWIFILALAIIISSLTACGIKDKTILGQERVLRIGIPVNYEEDETFFRQTFTDMFEIMHKNLRIELVPITEPAEGLFEKNDAYSKKKKENYMAAIKKQLDSANPVDVIVIDAYYYRKLVEKGRLKQLDPLMQKDKFDANGIVPTVRDGLKSMGNNQTYGIAPTFTAHALFFNKDAFRAAGVSPPTDDMTWAQIFNLAAAVSTGEGTNRQYGFAFNPYNGSNIFYSMLYLYTSPLNLRMYNDQATKMTVKSPQWNKAWTTMINLVKNKIMPPPNHNEGSVLDRENPFASDDFLCRRTAMVTADYFYMNAELSNAMKNADKIKGFRKFDWDVVTLPSHPEAPGISSSIQLQSIFAINQKAPNPDDAWKLLKFLGDDDWAKLHSRNTWDIVSRKAYIKPKNGDNINISAFYKMKPVPPGNLDIEEMLRNKPRLLEIEQMGADLMKDVMENKKTIATALQEWETKGNQLLLLLKQIPNLNVNPE